MTASMGFRMTEFEQHKHKHKHQMVEFEFQMNKTSKQEKETNDVIISNDILYSRILKSTLLYLKLII